MSKNEEQASEKEHDEPQSDSVFDFLYCDSQRIGSFLAQFDDSGHLERIIQRESVSKGIKRGIEFSVGGGAMLMGTGGSGNFGIKRAPSDQGSESSERVYDPLWANARSFLDYLAEREMIVEDITKASIGQFVKISGILKVLDLSLIRRIVEHPVLIKRIKAEAQKQVSSTADKKPAPRTKTTVPNVDDPKDIEFTMAFMSVVGMGTQAIINDRTAAAWANLKNEFLIVPCSELFLQHGLRITGEWTAIGVLDAKPGELAIGDDENLSPFVTALGKFLPAARHLGRPATHYGITPLLILREIPV